MVIMSLGGDLCNACGPLPRGIEAGMSPFWHMAAFAAPHHLGRNWTTTDNGRAGSSIDMQRLMTQCMVRPCVASGFRRAGGKRSCIDVSGRCATRVVLLAIMGISARASSLCDRPRLGQLGHQCSHAPGRPNVHLVSSSRRPRRVRCIDLATSSRAPHFARPL